MKPSVQKLLASLAGLLLGAVTYYYFYGWYNVFPWAVAAPVIGYASKSNRDCMINGALFGYFLFLIYIYAGYKGKTGTAAMNKFIFFT